MDVEAVLLTGGAGKRMGQDKASLLVRGKPLAESIGAELETAGCSITVLGRSPLPGHSFLADEEEYQGPLLALSRFKPRSPMVFVASCDLVAFRGDLVAFLGERMGGSLACVPSLDGRLQPLCALYRAEAFAVAARLAAVGERRVMAWVRELDPQVVQDLPDPDWARSVNTPEELDRFK